MTEPFASIQPSTHQESHAQADLKALDHALSHDVEGPLRGIKSLAAILLEKYAATIDGEARDLVKLMGTEAGRASRLVEALLDWLKFSQPLQSFTWQDTPHLVNEAFEGAKGVSGTNHVELQLAELPHLWSARAPLHRLLSELLSNALKFSAQRQTVVVTISAEDRETETIITVADNGAGFDPAYSGRLFSLFQRLHRQQDFEGTGAGLAIAQQIVRQHHGRIWADSRLGGGANFHFSFPKPVGGLEGGAAELFRS